MIIFVRDPSEMKIFTYEEVLTYILIPNQIPGSSRVYPNMPRFIHQYAVFTRLIV
jgi:hypothetical protein